MDVICLGELLIDFVSLDVNVSLSGSSGFGKSPGGAPANVAAGVSRLGARSGFIGKVGDDPFGHYLRDVLNDYGVDTKYLATDAYARTTLSFVAQKPDGDRDCMFYRNPGADMLLSPEEISEEYFHGAKVFHFGSISLGCEPVKAATLEAIRLAKQNGLIISYDPNLRLSLWPDADQAKREINAGFEYADFVKISDEEYGFITGCDTNEACADYILKKGAKLVIVTLGKDGCYYSDGSSSGYVKGFAVDTIETTGAGDAFVASVLTHFSEMLGSGCRKEDVLRIGENFCDIMVFANAAAAITTTKIGAIQSLPDYEQVTNFLKGR